MRKQLLLLLFSLCFAIYSNAQLESSMFWWHGGVDANLNNPKNWTDRYNDTIADLTPTGLVRDIVRIGCGWGSEDLNENDVLDPGEDLNGNGVIDSMGIGWGGYYGEGNGVDLDIDPVLSEEYVSRTGDSLGGWWFVCNAPNILTLEDGALLIMNKANSNLRNGGRLEVQGRSAAGGPSLKVAKEFRIAENGSITDAKDETSQLIINGMGWVQMDPELSGSGKAFYIGTPDEAGTMPRGEIIIEDNGRLEILPEEGNDPYLDFGNTDPSVNQIIIRGEGELWLAGNMDSIGRVGVNDSVVSLDYLIDNKLITTDDQISKLEVWGSNPTVIRVTINSTNIWWHGGTSSDLNDPLNWTDRDASTDPVTPTGLVRDIVRIGCGWGSEDLNDNDVLDPGEDLNGNGVIDSIGLGWGGYYGDGNGVELAVNPVLSETFVSRTGDALGGWWFICNKPNSLTLEDGAYLVMNKPHSNIRNGGKIEVKGRSDTDGPSLKFAKEFRIAENGATDLAKDDTSQLLINGTGWVQMDPALSGSGKAFYIGTPDDPGTMPRGEIIIEDNGRLEILPKEDDDPFLDFGNIDPAVNQIIIRGEGELWLPGDMDSIARVGPDDEVISLEVLIDSGLIATDEAGKTVESVGSDPTVVRVKIPTADHWWHGGINADLNDPLNWTDRDASTDPTTPTGKVRDIVRIGCGWGSEDLNDNDVLDPGEDLNGNGVIDSIGLGWGGYYGDGNGVELAVNPVLTETYVSRTGGALGGWWFVCNKPNSLTLEDGAYLVMNKPHSNIRNGGKIEVKGRSDTDGPSLKFAKEFRIAENGAITDAKNDTSQLIINGTGWVQMDPALSGSGKAFYIGTPDDPGTMPRGEIVIEDNGRLEILPEEGNDPYLDFGNKDSLVNQIILSDHGELWLPGDMDSIARVGTNDSIVTLQYLIDMGLITGGAEGLTVVGSNPTIVVAGSSIVEIDSIKVSAPDNKLDAGSTLQMTSVVYPDTAAIPEVTWSVTAGTGEATIDQTGLLTGVDAGTVTVVATAKDGSGVTGSMEITVEATLVSAITVYAPDNIVGVGATLQMTEEVLPYDAYNKAVVWSVTAGTGDATIGESGLLTGVALGTVTVVATADDISGVTGTKQITVITLVSSITVSAPSDSVDAGFTLQMTAEVSPAEAENKEVTWSVTKGTGDATIDADGLLTGVAEGTVTVVATAKDGSGVSGSKEITVIRPISVESITNSTYKVFPNPSGGMFNIELRDMHGTFVVYDLRGIAIATGVISDNKFTLDLTPNGKGVYLLRITAGEKSEISKLVVK